MLYFGHRYKQTDREKTMSDLKIAVKMLEHKHHKVEIVTYADENVAIECTDCDEVIYDEMYAL